jgi:thiamine biosynthesis lipoprotein
MVVAPTAALADALSTAFYVMGPRPSLAYCQIHPEIGTIMLCPGNHGGKVEIHSAGLDHGELAIGDV